MGEEAKVELTGDTAKLDQKIEASGRKQVELAKLTAGEMERINDALSRKALQDMERMGARAATATEAVGRPMVKLKQEFSAFSGIALRTGGAVAATLVAVTTAARAAVAELEKAQKLKAGLGKTAGDQTIEAVGALSKSGISDINKVLSAAQTAQGPAKQDEINTFLGKMGESKLKMSGDRAADLVRVFARNSPVLGDGSSLLAAQKLFPHRMPDALADAAISYRARTGKDLSLSDLEEKDKAVSEAEEKSNEAADKVMKARTGGSMSGLRSAEEAAWQARTELAKAQAERSAVSADAQPEHGAAAARLAEMGPQAIRAVAVRMKARQQEVREMAAGQDDNALTQQMRELEDRGRELNRAEGTLRGGASRFRALAGSVSEAVAPYIPGVTSVSDRAADAGAASAKAIERAIAEQTEALKPRPVLRPTGQDER